MRTSQKVLLGGVVFVMILMAAGVFGIRSVVSEFLGDEARADVGEFARLDLELSPDLVDFDRLLIRGAWDIDVIRGDDWSVEIAVPDDAEPRLNVGVNGERLVLDLDRGNRPWWMNNRSSGNHARITMPSLAGIEVQGAANIALDAFSGESLEIAIAGAANMQAAGGRFEGLDLTIGGAGNVQMREVRVTDARVSLSGASNVELTMAGGELVGQVSGLGRLEYSGTVSLEDVSASGFATVERAGR